MSPTSPRLERTNVDLSKRRPWRLRPSLRWTLLFSLLPLLTLPWLGLRFVDRMSELMRSERLENAALTAASLAGTLHERRVLFAQAVTTESLPQGSQALPTTLLAQVDPRGREDDWLDAPRQILPVLNQGSSPAPTLALRFSVARSQEAPNTLHLRLEAQDERLVPPVDDAGSPAPGDTVIVEYGDTPDSLRSIELTAAPPGETQALAARLQAREGGWTAQLSIDGLPRLLRIRVRDVDYLGHRRLEAFADSGLLAPVMPGGKTVSAAGATAPGSAALESAWVEAARALSRVPGRITVHDSRGIVLHQQAGPPVLPPPDDWSARLARSILGLASRTQPDRLYAAYQGERRSSAQGGPTPSAASAAPAPPLTPLASALNGVPAQHAQLLGSGAGLPAWRLVSAHPIWIGDQVTGAIVLEEDTAARHASGQRALEKLALLAALAVAVTVGTLLLLSTLTVGRIVRLRNQAEAAIDARGRVVGGISPSGVGDELGDLAAGYRRVLERLREHQDYLGNLRSRLVHELRTPIMVVRSSLENLVAVDDPAQREAYVERVRSGAERLEKIVASMSEASSLEAMLAGSRLDETDLSALLEGCAQGYRGAFASHRFEVDIVAPAGQARCAVVPEAIVQALDKLVSNAADFAPAGSVIRLMLRPERVPDARGMARDGGPGWSLSVSNPGPPLPEAMSESLFDSMVSIRAPRAGEPTHLGLGLYLVRLIAEFHGGRAFARNLPDGVQVGLLIRQQAATGA